MKKILGVALLCLLTGFYAKADEGMWLLPYIEKLNIDDMKAKGLKLEAEDIYSINNSSLKDAIVRFGGGCTGEIISPQGLVLTNHHCGYGSIQSHSSVEHDYLKDGFWAMSFAEEIPTPGLTVTFIRSIEDVTSEIVPHLKNSMTESERAVKVAELSAKIVEKAKISGPGMSGAVRAFDGGNQYMLFVSQVYNDVRLVGAPPSAIGKFGGDTDNWMWPRHTGDFSLFRVYTDKDGNPAPYSPENIPMVPKKYLTVSLQGVHDGDYAMIMGFPGSTDRYMTSYEIDETVNYYNPDRINVRGIRQDILMAEMVADPKVKIQYASKYAGSSNYWKNAIGMNRGLKKLRVKEQKEAIEQNFREWVKANPEKNAEYGEALELIEKGVKGRLPYQRDAYYINEALSRSLELISAANMLSNYAIELEKKEAGHKNNLDSLTEAVKMRAENFYKDYNMPTDKKVTKAMLENFMENVSEKNYPDMFELVKQEGGIEPFVEKLFSTSIFTSKEKLFAYLENPSLQQYKDDYAVIASKSVARKTAELNEAARAYNEMYAKGHRLFVAGLVEMDKDKVYYPDANSTIRLTYGQVLPYSPADAIEYDYVTTLTGVMEKEDPNNQYEFSVPQRLKELYNQKDFGQYAENGNVVTCFITNNDITGGNSGSPVLNGNGELVGIAFDGNWEAMSGDIAFEPNLQRCIAVDIRYVLFIIDKYAGATRLLEEMTIVK